MYVCMYNNRRRQWWQGSGRFATNNNDFGGIRNIRYTHNRSRETKIKIKKLYIFIIPLRPWGRREDGKKQVVASNKMVINLVHWTERIP